MTKKKRNLNVMHKNSIDNSLDKIHIMSMSMGTGAYIGTGVHKNKKYDKKFRRNENKKICKEY